MLRFYVLSVRIFTPMLFDLPCLRNPPVRETLTEDLIERLIVDLLEITESIQGESFSP
jgi:hypothetical protein